MPEIKKRVQRIFEKNDGEDRAAPFATLSRVEVGDGCIGARHMRCWKCFDKEMDTLPKCLLWCVSFRRFGDNAEHHGVLSGKRSRPKRQRSLGSWS